MDKSIIKDIFQAFVPPWTGKLKDWAGNVGGREEMTWSKRPQSGIEPKATAGRTQPLCMGRLFYQLNYHGALES